MHLTERAEECVCSRWECRLSRNGLEWFGWRRRRSCRDAGSSRQDFVSWPVRWEWFSHGTLMRRGWMGWASVTGENNLQTKCAASSGIQWNWSEWDVRWIVRLKLQNACVHLIFIFFTSSLNIQYPLSSASLACLIWSWGLFHPFPVKSSHSPC